MTVLLCIATGQNLANLIPALQLHPEEIWILATPIMKEQAKRLEKALRAHQLASHIVSFDDSSPESMEKGAEEIALKLDGKKVVFNATGGTKQMALILAETLRMLDAPGEESLEILYADTQHNRLDWLKPKKRSSVMMEDILSLEDILVAQGFRLGETKSRQGNWVETAEKRGELTRKLGDKAHEHSGFFGVLNMLAQRANGAEFRPAQHLDYEPSHRYVDLLKKAVALNLIEWDGHTQIRFMSEDSARYFGGGWLEEYTFFKLRGSQLRDYVVGASVVASDGKTENEFDALAVYRNRLLVIECKTLRFGRDSAKDADRLYKLDSLAPRAGGLLNTRWLLSARSLDEHSQRRAAELGIVVIEGEAIHALANNLKEWKKAGS